MQELTGLKLRESLGWEKETKKDKSGELKEVGGGEVSVVVGRMAGTEGRVQTYTFTQQHTIV